MTAASPPTQRPGPMLAFTTTYRLLLHGQLTRLRALGLLSLGLIGIVLAAVTRAANNVPEAATNLLADYGLGIVAPVCTLWVATSLLGDLVEDRLLVYLWLKPVSSWVLPASAVAATLTIMIPLVVVPLAIAAAVTGIGELVVPMVLATTLAVLGYSGMFVALGTRFNRALWWGLNYTLVWENSIARIADGTARLAIRSYVVSILSRASDVSIALADRSPTASVLVPATVAVAGIAVSAWILRNRDID